MEYARPTGHVEHVALAERLHFVDASDRGGTARERVEEVAGEARAPEVGEEARRRLRLARPDALGIGRMSEHTSAAIRLQARHQAEVVGVCMVTTIASMSVRFRSIEARPATSSP